MSATVHYQDDRITLWHGHALDVLRGMEDGAVDCVVTSPPYFGLRDYGVEGQIGAEPTVAGFIESLRVIFAEMRRVLADDGTFWLNLGDSYQSTGGHTAQGRGSQRKGRSNVAAQNASKVRSGLPGKNMLMIPARVAIALQDDGWVLRNDVVWAKPNAMPFSGKDRLANRYEHVFLFTKRPRYHFDLDAIRVPHISPQVGRAATFGRKTKEELIPNQAATQHREDRPSTPAGNPLGKNPGDVWEISTKPFPEAHFATYPPELPLRCIKAGCKPGGVVFDPFSGSGTTGMAALAQGHSYIGIDLNVDYLDLSLRTRLADR